MITIYGSIDDTRYPPEGTHMGVEVFRPVPGRDNCFRKLETDKYDLTPDKGQTWASFVEEACQWARKTFAPGDDVKFVAYWSEVHRFTV